AVPLKNRLHSIPIMPRCAPAPFNTAPTLRPSLRSASLWRFIVGCRYSHDFSHFNFIRIKLIVKFRLTIVRA
ncbi:MAG: hypothetical protein J5I54_03465, partial [Bacteroidales bacterium]|nr:hypothetical protein [Bacteroidales bacterium]